MTALAGIFLWCIQPKGADSTSPTLRTHHNEFGCVLVEFDPQADIILPFDRSVSKSRRHPSWESLCVNDRGEIDARLISLDTNIVGCLYFPSTAGLSVKSRLAPEGLLIDELLSMRSCSECWRRRSGHDFRSEKAAVKIVNLQSKIA